MEASRHALIAAIAKTYQETEDQSGLPGVRTTLATYAAEIEALFETIAVPVEFVDAEPYASAKIMRREVLEKRVLRVSALHNVHPVLSPSVNLKARAVHDLLSHLALGADFSFEGEVTAYTAQRALHDPSVDEVLFSEIVAQAAVRFATGRFEEQKIVCFSATVRARARRQCSLSCEGPGLVGLVALGLVKGEILAAPFARHCTSACAEPVDNTANWQR